MFKKSICLIVALLFFISTLPACGDTQVINGVEYDTYGLLNESEKRNPDIEYELIVGNVIWSIILIESIVFPIYFIGFSLWEPVGPKGKVTKGEVRS